MEYENGTKKEMMKMKRKDPICGMDVDETTPYKFELDGQTYYFCSAGCMEKFKAEPEKYK